MLYHEYAKPFFRPLSNLFDSLFTKLVVGIPFASAIDWSIFTTPTTYWQGLGWLVLLDFVSGVLKVLIDPEQTFESEKFIRTAYKISAYVILTAAVTIGNNVFPRALGWLQYVVYLLLFGKEIVSIAQNFGKLRSILRFSKVLKDKGISNITLSDFKGEDHEY